MKFVRISFLFFELMVVINSSYSYIPRPSNTLNRYRKSISTQRCEIPVLQNGMVRLSQRGRVARFLCKPGFTFIGDRYSGCVRGEWANPIPKCIKPGCPAIVPPENGHVISDANGALMMFFCLPGYSVAGSDETFCNGNVWDRSLGICVENPASLVLTCDFEVNTICGWEAEPTHDLEWKRKNGYTSAQQTQTGPQHDNTVGIPLEGHFMLATFSSQTPNSVARLISPTYPAAASKNACFRLYYHMYGATTGILRIYSKPESFSLSDVLGTPKCLLMEKNGTYENAWLESVVAIDEFDDDFQIIIEARTIDSTRSNMAIDDVALMSGDDCIKERSKSTTVTPEEGGIYDTQTCVNRCQETTSNSRYVTKSTLTSSNKTVNILQCDCFDGCVDLNSCCLDYRSVCVFNFPVDVSPDTVAVTEQATPDLSTSSIMSIRTKVSTPTTVATVSTTTATQTTITTLPTGATPSTMPAKTILTIKTTPTAKPFQSTSTPSSTISTIKTKPTVKPVSSISTPSSSISVTVESTTASVASTSTIASFRIASTITHTKDTKSSTDVSVAKPNDDEDVPVFQTLLLIVLGILVILTAIIAIIKFWRKRQQYSDDCSDKVRFLTAEEELHFSEPPNEWL